MVVQSSRFGEEPSQVLDIVGAILKFLEKVFFVVSGQDDVI